MQAMQFEIVVCPEVLREVRKALRKPYFRERVICSTTKGRSSHARSAPAKRASYLTCSTEVGIE